MDPGQLATDLLQKHFPKFGSFRKLCQYHSLGDQIYSPDSGLVHDEEHGSAQIWIIFDMPSSSLLNSIGVADDDTIRKMLRVAIFPAKDLPFMPAFEDEITREDSSQWTVIGVAPDPKPAHYELVVRPI